MQVYDGSDRSFPLLGTFCGNDDVEDIISTSTTVIMFFHTDSGVTRRGFSITYSPAGKCFTSHNMTEPTKTTRKGIKFS